MPDPDTSTWFTKQLAAAAIGVSTKTVEKLAQDGKLERATRPSPNGGADLVVYDPSDVARIAQERRPARAPFVLPATPTGNGNGHQTQALAVTPPTPAGYDAVRLFFDTLMTVAQQAQVGAASENSQKLFLTLAEAAIESGLSEGYLRRAIKAGSLPAVKDRGWRIRRKDLEQL